MRNYFRLAFISGNLTFLVGLIPVAYFAANKQLLPDPLPLHWNASGEADRYGSPEFGNIFLQFGIGPLILGLVSLSVTGLGKSVMGNNDRLTESQKARKQLLYPRYSLVIAVWLLILAVAIEIGVLLSTFRPGFPVWLDLLVIALLSVGLFVAIARVFNSVNRKIPPEGDERFLKWGLIYFNPEDTRLMISSPDGMNTTLNLARPAAYLFLLALLAPAILIIVLVAVFQ